MGVTPIKKHWQKFDFWYNNFDKRRKDIFNRVKNTVIEEKEIIRALAIQGLSWC